MSYFLSNGELRVVAEVVEYGRQWGYGNMIHRLRIAWVLDLRKSGLSWETACLAAGLEKNTTAGILKSAKEDERNLIKSLREYTGLKACMNGEEDGAKNNR